VKPSQAGGIALPCSCHPTQWDSADLDNGVWARVDEAEEPLGTKDKFWVQDTDGTRWLFKFGRQKHGVVRGEDWAEWLVHGLANLMGVPTACIRPATSSGQRGIISRSVVESDQRLEHGNELLARINPAYDVKAARQNAGYTVDAIRMSSKVSDRPLQGMTSSNFRASMSGPVTSFSTLGWQDATDTMRTGPLCVTTRLVGSRRHLTTAMPSVSRSLMRTRPTSLSTPIVF
jgi:hypothetical protein